MGLKQLPRNGPNIPIFLIIEIIFFIIQMIASHTSEEDGVKELMKKYGLSESKARELWRRR